MERSNKGPQALMASFEVGGQAAFAINTLDGRALRTRPLESPTAITASIPTAITVPGTRTNSAPIAAGRPQAGWFVCPDTVLGDSDRLTRDNPNAPDRTITTPTMITEVDPQGMGLFTVEGSANTYYLKSGPPPQANCGPQSLNAPSGDAILTILKWV